MKKEIQRSLDNKDGKVIPSDTNVKLLPGPQDWGYRYEPTHQRDPFDPSKPLPR